ncbi:MAG: response regulator [Methanomicrobiales archaeon]|nr:response regulator [Methanomicrobiales archaeon]
MKKILIIDDSSFQRKIISSILQEAGYTLVVTDNGRDGFAAIEKERPDLVITDLLMPEFDGFYFLEQAKAHGIPVPVLILTSDIQDTTRAKCLSLGAARVINKPVKKEVLLAAVASVFAGEQA